MEVQIPRSTPMVGLLEPVLERVVYEDIPFNLAAVKQHVEDRKLQRRITELEEQGEHITRLHGATVASIKERAPCSCRLP